MKKRLILVLMVSIAGCASEAEKAERELEIVEQSSFDKSEICAASIRARDAWLRAGEREKYELASLRAVANCPSRRY